ncbi:MAG TPA: Rrf2 family transcriptional regulator [Thermoleophilaceae bacterium]|nr:Rrf2 family transcriptional regulator [Thermoleophilaceae bacterium]
MRISAKTDYALRAAIELASLASADPVKGETIAKAQGIPLRFLENILGDLRNANVVESRRGVEGGYLLARDPADITLADVIRAVDGPLANVAGTKPNALTYHGSAEQLREIWVAVRAALRSVLEETTLADMAGKKLPDHVRALIADQDAWEVR